MLPAPRAAVPPELLRSPLEDVCLHVKLLLEQTQEAGTIASFLQEAPDPPEALSVPNLAWAFNSEQVS